MNKPERAWSINRKGPFTFHEFAAQFEEALIGNKFSDIAMVAFAPEDENGRTDMCVSAMTNGKKNENAFLMMAFFGALSSVVERTEDPKLLKACKRSIAHISSLTDERILSATETKGTA